VKTALRPFPWEWPIFPAWLAPNGHHDHTLQGKNKHFRQSSHNRIGILLENIPFVAAFVEFLALSASLLP
jgi:hypothetical protein